MKVGVIGVGVQGERHVRVYSELKNVDSVTVYDANPDAIQKVLRRYDGVRVASDISKLLDRVDAVSICTPTKTHFDVVMDAIDSHTPFLVEKPFTDRYADAVRILDHYNKINRNLTCGVGHIERFNPVTRAIESLMRDPLYIEIKRHNPSSARTIGVSNVIDDLMIHDIDVLFNVFFSGYDFFKGEDDFFMHPVGNGDVCGCLFDLGKKGGGYVPVYISASRKSAKKTRTLYIETGDLTIDGNYNTQDIYVHRQPSRYELLDGVSYKQENVVDKIELGKQEPLRLELVTFLESVLTGEEFPVTLKQAAMNVYICERIKCGLGVDAS